MNEVMFIFYKWIKGEFSRYFLGLRDAMKIHGIRCPKCRAIRVPPFELMCPDCEFAEMEYVEMPDRGVMNSTPPITYFAHSLFQSFVPFGRGRVVLEGAETALPIQVYTTKGILTPCIFKRGTHRGAPRRIPQGPGAPPGAREGRREQPQGPAQPGRLEAAHLLEDGRWK